MTVKSKVKTSARWLAMPIVRPIEQAMESGAAIKADLARVREMRELRRQKQEEERHLIDAEALKDPTKIKNAAQRFDAFYQLRNWNEDDLSAQLGAFKITKRACVLTCLFMLFVAIAGLFILPGIVQLLMAPVILTISAAMLAMAFRYGLWQSHLETRSLHSPAEYVARPDFFWHLFWG